jgi:hypothetical protein
MSRKQSSLAAYDDDADDIVWGVEGESGIAATIKRTTAQAYHLIRNREKNRIPVARHGHKTYSASRRRLRAWCAGELPD